MALENMIQIFTCFSEFLKTLLSSSSFYTFINPSQTHRKLLSYGPTTIQCMPLFLFEFLWPVHTVLVLKLHLTLLAT